MTIVTLFSLYLFLLSLIALLVVFLFYPLFLYLRPPRGCSPQTSGRSDETLRVSLIVVVHNAESLIESKIRNSLSLDYPHDHLEIFFCSDGSTDETEALIRPYISERIQLLTYPQHQGKAAVLNDIAPRCGGDLVMFSDVDAILAPDSLKLLVRHFSDDVIGGVSGSRVIRDPDDSSLTEPQKRYIFADNIVKLLESRSGSTTSNDGKLYIIRRSLFRPISPAATDDLFTCLSIVSQGKRFVFEPDAHAYIGKPSQDTRHEITRRRRIVCRSLNGIWSMRTLLNPIRFKSFALGLLINKVVRRALPLFLGVLLISSALLALRYPLMGLLVAVQLFFYFLALLQFISIRFQIGLFPAIDRTSALAFYFCLGNIGTFLGVLDFISGKRYEKWEPMKSGSAA